MVQKGSALWLAELRSGIRDWGSERSSCKRRALNPVPGQAAGDLSVAAAQITAKARRLAAFSARLGSQIAVL
jgi:hypothetical protein